MADLPATLLDAARLLQNLQALQDPSEADTRLRKLLLAHLQAPLPEAERWRYLQLRLKQHDRAAQGPLSPAEAEEFEGLRAQAEGHALQTMDAVLQQVALAKPTAPPWIWSRGWFDWAMLANPGIPAEYFAAVTEARAPVEFVQEHLRGVRGFVWLRCGSADMDRFAGASDVDTFAEHALDSVQAPFVLVTTDGDRSVPSQLRATTVDRLLAHPMLTRWYTQNCDGTRPHPKLQPIPIGLDLHTGVIPDERMMLLQHLQAQAAPWRNRPAQVSIDALGNTHPERVRMLAMLEHAPHMRVSRTRLPFAQAMQNYAACQFAMSPRGNGWDCHRTWELLLLGTVPIVRSGPLDSLYNGLPVMIVADWDAVLDADNLRRWAEPLQPLLLQPGTTWLQRERWVPAPQLTELPEGGPAPAGS